MTPEAATGLGYFVGLVVLVGIVSFDPLAEPKSPSKYNWFERKLDALIRRWEK